MNLKDIAEKYLKDNGYDGLWNENIECGCVAEDLFPCENADQDCKAGYMTECDCGEDCQWHIGSKKAE